MQIDDLVAEFTKKFHPQKRNHLRMVGIECEIPVVTREGNAIERSLIQNMYRYLASHGFDLQYDLSNQTILSATRAHSQTAHPPDTVTTDTGFCTLEIALAPQPNLHIIQVALSKIIDLLLPYFDRHQCKMLGYGIQPVTAPSRHLLEPRERYLFFKRFSSNRLIDSSLGADSDLLNITASNQCHVEVTRTEAIPVTNVLNALAGLQVALSANSPIWQGTQGSHKATRELFWHNCFPDRLAQIGIPPCFDSINEYLAYLLKFKPLLVLRNGHYFQIVGKTSLEAFFFNGTTSKGLSLDNIEHTITPQLNDIHQFNKFCYFNARLVPRYGTVENRIFCQQPPGETLTSAALTVGIVEQLADAIDLVNQHSWSDWKQLRQETIKHAFHAQIANQPITQLLVDLLAIAQSGLKRRNLGEEKFLTPLYKRLENKRSPADVAIAVFHKEGIKGLVNHSAFGEINI